VRIALPKQSNRRVEHFAAMAYADVSSFLIELRQRQESAARALEFLILCANRTREIVGARWSEIDFQTRTWTVPGERMKNSRPHTIPLTDRAIEILNGLDRDGDRIFPIAEHHIRRLLHAMRPGCTVHGFRSSFKQFCTEKTNVPDHVVEQALAHTIGNAVERAYRRRAELFDRRRRLMEQWSQFCMTPAAPANVVAFHA